MVVISFPLSVSQSFRVLPEEMERMVLPSGEKALSAKGKRVEFNHRFSQIDTEIKVER